MRDAVVEDLARQQRKEAKAGECRCPECGKEYDILYKDRLHGHVVGCDSEIDKHYTDDAGYENFACPNNCHTDPENAKAVYDMRKTREPVGCEHCIYERNYRRLN